MRSATSISPARPIIGRFEGRRSGHKLNHRLLRALFQRREAWCWSDSNASGPVMPEPRRAGRPSRLTSSWLTLALERPKRAAYSAPHKIMRAAASQRDMS